MAQRGVAWGKPGTTPASFTEAVQGRFHYVYGPYANPVLHVQPGDRRGLRKSLPPRPKRTACWDGSHRRPLLGAKTKVIVADAASRCLKPRSVIAPE